MSDCRITAVTLADSRESAAQAVLLARSLRRFGGALADSAMRLYVPSFAPPLPLAVRDELAVSAVELVELAVPDEVAAFPFAGKVYAAAAAELDLEDIHRSRGIPGSLLWMDADTLILREPRHLTIREGETLCYRPVHHKLIGSDIDEPLDAYWALVYEACHVPEGAVFPMLTCADRRRVRPYFNAGLLGLRPEAGIMREWLETFAREYRRPELARLYRRDARYAVFIHQALLSGVILARLDRSAMRELPEWYNYPLHLHADYAPDRRPERLDDLTTCRYEKLPPEPGWWGLTMSESLRGWLVGERERLGGLPGFKEDSEETSG